MEIINEIIKDYQSENSPGLAIAYINRDGTVIHSCGGYANLNENIPVASTTNFNIASVSKTITAAAIYLLYKNHKISLRDSVLDYIPELGNSYQEVQILHLINHSSGIKDYYNPLSDSGKNVFNRDVINFLIEQNQLDFEPNTNIDYINSGYVLLAEIIARVSGQSYPDFLESNIFQPLGMDNTFVLIDENSPVSEQSEGYFFSGNGIFPVKKSLYTCGDSNIYSNLEDMIIWIKTFTGDQFFSAVDKKSLFQIHRLKNNNEIAFRSAWIPRKNDGNDVLEIIGGVPGFGCLIANYIDAGFGFVLLTNNNDQKLWGKTLEKLYDRIDRY